MTDLPKPKRTRRFALPAHDDHRAVEAIDALLGAPPAVDEERHVDERGRGRAAANSAFGGLDSRLEFLDAIRREDERVRRYRRPAAVAVLAIVPLHSNGVGPSNGASPTVGPNAAVGTDQSNGTGVLGTTNGHEPGMSRRDLERASWRLVEATTRAVRETDRVARVGPGTLEVLLPETRTRQAERVVARIRESWEERMGEEASGLRLLTAVASPPPGEGVVAGLDRAEAAVERAGRTPERPGRTPERADGPEDTAQT